MDAGVVAQTREQARRLSSAAADWPTLVTDATAVIQQAVPFDACCWHTVDPGTVMLTGSLNQNVECSGTWLATHEYVIDDVNRWWFLARSGRMAGATSLATHGDLDRSARHRSQADHGFGDELRAVFVADGVYWGAVGFLRAQDRPWFTEPDVRLLAELSETLARGFRRTLFAPVAADLPESPQGPGVVIFDADGQPESVSPAAERWIEQMLEVPPPRRPAESKAVQAVAARARTAGDGDPRPPESARSRVRTRFGDWLLLYGTRLSGPAAGRTAVIIQPATPAEVAPLVAMAYGLSAREMDVIRLCLQGCSTRQMARLLDLSPYTVQDHLKSVFAKTGARSRGELVGQVFLDHYASRWEPARRFPPGWTARGATGG